MTEYDIQAELGCHYGVDKGQIVVPNVLLGSYEADFINREYAIKKINEVLEQVDDTRLADIIIELIQFPGACEYCANEFDECCCTQGIKKWLQSKDTSRQR